MGLITKNKDCEGEWVLWWRMRFTMENGVPLCRMRLIVQTMAHCTGGKGPLTHWVHTEYWVWWSNSQCFSNVPRCWVHFKCSGLLQCNRHVFEMCLIHQKEKDMLDLTQATSFFLACVLGGQLTLWVVLSGGMASVLLHRVATATKILVPKQTKIDHYLAAARFIG